MARFRATRRRFALVSDHERRDDPGAVVERRAGSAGNEDVRLVARAEAAPGIPLPPAVPTNPASPTPSPTGDPVNIPSSTVSIIPVACAIAGTLFICALAFFFWYRKQRRAATVNKRNTWYDPAKYSNKAPLSIEPPPSSASTDKPAATAYPPRKVSAQTTSKSVPRSGPPAPSPLRKQTDLDTKSKTGSAKSATSSTTTLSSSSPAKPTTSVEPGSTPSDKAAEAVTSTPPVASANQLSFLQDARGQEAPRVQPMKRSASLLSSRMSTRRKPQRQDTAPAASTESDEPVVPSLRVTDADSPLEDAKPAHPLAGKLVTVIDPYDATMPDELSVVPGETLRVLEAYDDDWCLAERIGRKKGRGILPQICVAEKGSVRANMRFSMLMREGQ